MKEQSTERPSESRPSWEDVEAFARQRIQTWFQRLPEEEVEELLGRTRYARRDGVDALAGYRNGLGKPRRLTLSAGTITVRRPRVRGPAHEPSPDRPRPIERRGVFGVSGRDARRAHRVEVDQEPATADDVDVRSRRARARHRPVDRPREKLGADRVQSDVDGWGPPAPLDNRGSERVDVVEVPRDGTGGSPKPRG